MDGHARLLGEEVERLRADIGRLTAEVEAWRECARYTPMMEGPAFMGWDRSALDRCRKQYIETAIKRMADSNK